jgi:hypothetical protein
VAVEVEFDMTDAAAGFGQAEQLRGAERALIEGDGLRGIRTWANTSLTAMTFAPLVDQAPTLARLAGVRLE